MSLRFFTAFCVRLSNCFLKICELNPFLKRENRPHLKRENAGTGRLRNYHHQHSFTKGKCCLTNPLVFYDGMTKSVNKGRTTDATFSQIEKYVFHGQIFCWIRNWLNSCIRRVVVRGSALRWRPVMSGALQGSVLGSRV